MISLTDKILAIDDSLSTSGLAYAFGGALALAFHVQEPRGTRDIDVNVFVPAEGAATAFAALPDAVAHSSADLALAQRDGQVRLFWAETPVDLFLITHPFHNDAALNAIRVPFAGHDIPVLGATDLCVCKALFNRTKDWADIEAMAEVGSFDPHRVIGWIVDLLGPTDERIERLHALLR